MNLHKNKIIMLAIVWVIILIAIFIVINVNKTNEKKSNTKRVKEFTIWTTWDSEDKSSYNALLKDFKEKNKTYKNTSFKVTVFPNYLSYKKTLQSAIINNKTPDMFSLSNFDNNNEVSEQILWVTSEVVSTDYIRKNFLWVLWRDMIMSYTDWEWDDAKQVEFLAWLPLWYDKLSLIYNAKYLRWKDLSSWAWINSAITNLKEQKPDLVPIALWRWTGITNSSDIFSQMLIQDWNSDLWTMQDKAINSTILRYSAFWSTRWDNKFDKLESQIKNWKTDIDFLAKSQTTMMIWYLKDLKKIVPKASILTKKFLRVWNFPKYTTKETPELISYNYFLINKHSDKTQLAKALFKYFSSKDWQRQYAKEFQYSIPADLSIIWEISDNKVDEKMVIKYKDFYNDQTIHTSFNKGVVELYDVMLPEILDSLNIKNEFTNLKSAILCVYTKVSEFNNLEMQCGY